MTLLILGILLFTGVHLFPEAVNLRAGVIARFGEMGYKAGFALLSLVGFALIIVGKGQAEFVPLWQPPVWSRHVAYPLMLCAFVLLPAANMPTNIKRFTRHPMLWGVTLWALAHLTANGDLASVILFGGFGGYALVDMWLANKRGDQKSEEVLPIWKDAIVIVAGLVAYAVFVVAHPYLFGVSLV